MAEKILRVYSGEPYGVFPWGAAGYEDHSTKVRLEFATNQSVDIATYLRYATYRRYTGTELNVEDIYSNYTYRTLALGALDGPLLSYSEGGG